MSDLRERLAELARLTATRTPVVSLYLNTRWADEHQRERVRVFVRSEVRRAREGAPAALAADLDWIEATAAEVIAQARFPDARGVVLFACAELGLREVHPVRVPFEDILVVADRPYLRPLVEQVEGHPDTLVVFVDARTARLIPVGLGGDGNEVTLESAVEGHHRRGGWALLAQSRYQRALAGQRARHLEAVADAVAALVAGRDDARIVLAGEEGTVAELRRHLPRPLADRVVGTIRAARHEPASALTARADEVLARAAREAEAAAVDAVLTEAAKGGRAVAGVRATLEAVVAGAVHRLYLLKTFREPGVLCGGCGTMQPGAAWTCPRCGRPTEFVELGEAMTDRVVATGGTVDVVAEHAGLAAAGGVAARLRYRRSASQ